MSVSMSTFMNFKVIYNDLRFIKRSIFQNSGNGSHGAW